MCAKPRVLMLGLVDPAGVMVGTCTRGIPMWHCSVIRRTVVLTLVAVAVLGMGLVISGQGPFASCSDRERRGYPEVEAVATRTMPQSAILKRTSACEMTGSPRPGVSAVMH